MRRVEHAIESGWPDVHYSHENYSGWIELKSKKKFPSKIKFEPAQPIWLDKYHKAGGSCYVFLQVMDEGLIYVWSGRDAYLLNEVGGCREVEPLMVTKNDASGWAELEKFYLL